MPTKRSIPLPEYALSDEAAAYIADALMNIALQFESRPLGSNPPLPPSHRARACLVRQTPPFQRRVEPAVLVLSCFAGILWFGPRREHSSVPAAKSRSRRAQGLSRLAASSRQPEGLGLDGAEHGGILQPLRGWRRKPLVRRGPNHREFQSVGIRWNSRRW